MNLLSISPAPIAAQRTRLRMFSRIFVPNAGKHIISHTYVTYNLVGKLIWPVNLNFVFLRSFHLIPSGTVEEKYYAGHEL